MQINDFPDSIIVLSTEFRNVLDEGYNANCHGYTITGEHITKSKWREVITYSNKMRNMQILVYTYKHNVSHSGRIKGDKFVHFIQNIGIVITPLEVARQVKTEYMDQSFILPTEKLKYSRYMERQNYSTNSFFP